MDIGNINTQRSDNPQMTLYKYCNIYIYSLTCCNMLTFDLIENKICIEEFPNIKVLCLNFPYEFCLRKFKPTAVYMSEHACVCLDMVY